MSGEVLGAWWDARLAGGDFGCVLEDVIDRDEAHAVGSDLARGLTLHSGSGWGSLASVGNLLTELGRSRVRGRRAPTSTEGPRLLDMAMVWRL